MKRNLFLRYFPAPEFLKIPSVGINISDDSIYYVELIDSEGGKKLEKFGSVDLPKGVISKGKIIQKEKIVEVLKLIRKKCEFDFVKSSVAENNSYIFRTKIPKKEKMTKDEIFAALSFKIEENIPMKLEDIVFDFDILGEKNGYLEIVVSALPAEIVNNFTEVFIESGFKPLFFEVESQAIARAAILEGEQETSMVVDFRRFRTGISIVSEGVVQFTATLEIGEEDLVSAVEKYLKVSRNKALEVVEEKGFIKEGSNAELFYAMMGTVAALKDEINKYLIYWNSHEENKKKKDFSNKVKKVLLCGSGGAVKGVDDFLSLSIGINVEKINAWKNIFSLDNYIPDMDYTESLEYVAAIGLSISPDDIVFSTKKI